MCVCCIIICEPSQDIYPSRKFSLKNSRVAVMSRFTLLKTTKKLRPIASETHFPRKTLFGCQASSSKSSSYRTNPQPNHHLPMTSSSLHIFPQIAFPRPTVITPEVRCLINIFFGDRSYRGSGGVPGCLGLVASGFFPTNMMACWYMKCMFLKVVGIPRVSIRGCKA